MAHLRIQHTLQGSSNLPEDRFVNVFHVQAPDPVNTNDLEDVATAIANFYDAVPSGQPYALAHVLNTGADATGRSIKIYNMADPMPRAPIFQVTPAAIDANSSTDNLPEELAICLSYRGDPNSGIPAARLRGRIYTGPFTMSAMASGSNLVQAKPADTVRDILLAAGRDLALAIQAANCSWSVWSTVEDGMVAITQVSVDNAWDIQRRRGHAPSVRTVLAV